MTNRATDVGQRILVAKTCSTCKQLKDANRFSKIHDGLYHDSCCKDCRHKWAKDCDRRSQVETVAKAKKSYDPWTHTDYATLAVLTEDGLTIREVALKMGRSYSSILQRRHLIKKSQEHV